MSAKTQAVTDASFESEVLKSGGPVLVDFYADWCGPCKAMSPHIDELSGTHGDKLKVLKLNIDDSPNTPTKYNIRGVPTFIIFKDGVPAATRVGGMSKTQLTEWVESAV